MAEVVVDPQTGELYALINGEYVHVEPECNIMGADTDILTLDDKPHTADELMIEVTDDNIEFSEGSEEEHIEVL